MNQLLERLKPLRPRAERALQSLKEHFAIQPNELLVITRPAVWLEWLNESKKFIFGGVAQAFFAKFLFAYMAAPLFKKIYPTKAGGFLDGVFGKKGMPRWQSELNDWSTILLYAGLAIAVVGLWRAIRPISRRAAQKVTDLENSANADSIAGNLAPALVGFQEAKRWAADANHRKLLDDKASIVRAKLAGQTTSAGLGMVSSSGAQPMTSGTQMITPAGVTMISQGAAQTVGPGGRYEIRRLLGKGGMGEVHEAFDTSLDRIIALKQLPANLANDTQFLQRFMQEGKALAKVSHPFIVQIYDIIRDQQGCYIALEFVAGGDLQSKIEREGKLAPAVAASLARKMAEGLAFAHEQGIVHRDIKPLNILLTKDGQPKLTDFGLAKIEASIQMTVDGAIMGSPAYMSPEQASGKTADFRSDVYSFGIMLYHMLAGRTPYEGDTGQVLAMHLTQRVPELAGAPSGLNAIVQKCTEPKPEHRYPSGAEIAQAFAQAQTLS